MQVGVRSSAPAGMGGAVQNAASANFTAGAISKEQAVRFGSHMDGCVARRDFERHCTCGFYKLKQFVGGLTAAPAQTETGGVE